MERVKTGNRKVVRMNVMVMVMVMVILLCNWEIDYWEVRMRCTLKVIAS